VDRTYSLGCHLVGIFLNHLSMCISGCSGKTCTKGFVLKFVTFSYLGSIFLYLDKSVLDYPNRPKNLELNWKLVL
jgi:hypothetical protein